MLAGLSKSHGPFLVSGRLGREGQEGILLPELLGMDAFNDRMLLGTERC